MDDNGSGSGLLAGVILGVIAGVTLGMLLAPQAGRDTRELVEKTIRSGVERIRKNGDEAALEEE